ncbi:SURF1 family protein [Sphingomonas sp. DT-204]|uniref:SURF1 family protein n=1 Tax=Sphingomonas sp. DT-204 TaxID=3396166 RepID=UPI003F1B71BC
MRRPVPIVATIVVLLAVAAMVALGIWQLQRRHEKLAALGRYAANIHAPPIAFPRFGIGDEALFRKSSAYCLRPLSWSREAGRDASGRPGWRQIVTCTTGAEGPPLTVQLGVAASPEGHPGWKGGEVSGWISHAPSHRSLIAGLFDRAPKPLMLVAATPVMGLAPNPGPDLSAVPNNHLAYAVQWFVFAAIALIIYAIALRRRLRGAESPRA